MDLPKVTRGMIREQTSEQSFELGSRYSRDGSVLELVRRGNHLFAEVAGSQFEPYQVEIDFDDAGITLAFCSCPYDWGGWCKHIVAVLLNVVEAPEIIDERPPLESLIADLDREQLQELLLQVAEGNAPLVDRIESYVAGLQAREAPEAQEPTPQESRPPVDPIPFRRRVRHLLHSLDGMRPSQAYWEVGGVVGGVDEVLDDAWTFIQASDGRNALLILEAITDEYTRQWYYLDDSDGDAGGFFEDLGRAWTEAVLTADLTGAERREWTAKLQAWQSEVDDYGVDAFAVALEALEQGWDYAPLQRVLEGEVTRLGAWEDENAPWYADELAEARLNVLERRERYDEYLHLAEAEGQTARYVTMLVHLDRVQEAVEYGLQYLSTTDEALALAQALREHGEIEKALRIAGHGLSLHGHKARLAGWLRDTAEGAGRTELALDAAVIAFQESPDLAAYQRVEELAGTRWPELRQELLDLLRRREATGSGSTIDIFLHEGLVDDAIAALGEWAYYDTVARVADAAIEQRPDWVIGASKKQAEQIMDAGKAKIYHHAVEWIARVKAAYQAAGQEAEWRAYLDELLEKHHRKYKLVPMLERLK
ncbi:MAG: SWIM zinc finger domain-containing protein [Anaerolineales bacterium]